MNFNFVRYSAEISALDYSEAVSAGRRIHQLVSALWDVEQFHQVDVNLQTKQYLWDTRDHLHRMLKTVNVARWCFTTSTRPTSNLLRLLRIPLASVRSIAFTLKVRRAPISVGVLVLNDPAAWRSLR